MFTSQEVITWLLQIGWKLWRSSPIISISHLFLVRTATLSLLFYFPTSWRMLWFRFLDYRMNKLSIFLDLFKTLWRPLTTSLGRIAWEVSIPRSQIGFLLSVSSWSYSALHLKRQQVLFNSLIVLECRAWTSQGSTQSISAKNLKCKWRSIRGTWSALECTAKAAEKDRKRS